MGNERLKMYPPERPIQFPLVPNDIHKALGIAKSTLLRWEHYGKIPQVKQVFKGGLTERQYSEDDLIAILKNLQGKLNINGQPLIRWLQGIDLDTYEGTIITTPYGYRLNFEPKTETEKT